MTFPLNPSIAPHSRESSQRGGSLPSAVWIGIVLVAVSVGIVNVLYYGDVIATVTLFFVTFVLIVSFLRPSVSLYIMVFLALSIEQFSAPHSWTELFSYHKNLNNVYLSLRMLSVTPLELHILCIIIGWLLRFIILRERFVPVIAWKQLLLYSGSILFFVAFGLLRGGAALPALWEVRAIFYLVGLMVVVPQIIRSTKQIQYVLWTLIVGLASRAVEVTTHYVLANFKFPGGEGGWGNHEDAGLLVTLLVFTLALYVLNVKGHTQKVVATLLVIPVVMAIIGSDRRAAYPVLAASLLLFGMLMPREIQRRLLGIGWKAGVVFVIYLGSFWQVQSDHVVFMPVRNIRMGLAGDDETEAGDSYTSNLYRKVEDYDVYKMISESSLLGTGYGVPINYELPIPILWELGFYIPHNQILAVTAKSGAVGFVIFLLFYLSILAEIAHGFGQIVKDPYLKAVLVFAGVAVVNHLVFAFFDIVLTYYRSNIFLGTLLGIAAAILAIEKQQAIDEPVSPSISMEETLNTSSGLQLSERQSNSSESIT